MIKNINFDVAIGFNITGLQHWQDVIDSGKINVIWTVDSIFSQNAKVFRIAENNQNNIVFGVTPDDIESAKVYLPKLKYAYMPHATDKDLWKNNSSEKENDIVFLSSLYDYENKLESIKDNNILYSLVNEFVDIILKLPNLNFWQIYNEVNKYANLNLNVDDYTILYNYSTFIAEQKLKIKMIQELSDFKVKIYGNDLWQKYIKGKVQYMGKADIKESINIINKSKISLHYQIPQLINGLHERFLNASSIGTFTLTNDAPAIKNEFSDNFAYFTSITFDGIKNMADYYLKNEEEREEKAKNAMQIVHQNHLWKNRAESINKLFAD